MEYPSAAAFANCDYFMRKRRATGEPSVPNGCVPVSTGVFATLLAITFSFFLKKKITFAVFNGRGKRLLFPKIIFAVFNGRGKELW